MSNAISASSHAFRSDPASASPREHEIIGGLFAQPKRLPAKYLYDERGSQLFEDICEVEEYYVTRTEMGVLERYAGEIAEQLGRRALLFELGSGASEKVRLLLRELREPAAYVPIDISSEILLDSAAEVQEEFPNVPVFPVCADFTRPLEIPEPLIRQVGSRVAFFPGSTIGNFDPVDARAFLSRVARFLGPGGRLLIGVDLVKDVGTLERAYDDRAGVTAAFNLNLLTRLNREHAADFDPTSFRHEARFNREKSRIEMHLVSERPQEVRVAGETIRFARGESIHTENSYKYEPERFLSLAAEAGYAPIRTWTDANHYFGVFLLGVHTSDRI